MFMKLDAQLLPGDRHVSEEPLDRLVSTIGRGADENPARNDLDVGITAVQEGGAIAAIEGVGDLPQHLEVLLRHRPRSISRLRDYRSSS
jgi:hypothetical protein